MPPKIRQLEKALLAAGFERLAGKGSHRKFKHATGTKLTLSGRTGSDAHPYQIHMVNEALNKVKT